MTDHRLASHDGDAPTFEIALSRIRDIVALLESGDLTLEESITKYQDGAHLIEQCRTLIANAELRIRELSQQQDAEATDA